MKVVLPSTAYTFDASAKQLDFSAATGFELQRLLGAINAKTGQLIYAPGLVGLGSTSFTSNVLTLVFNTTSMSDDDPLMIFYDQPAAGPIPNLSYPLPESSAPIQGAALAIVSNTSVGLPGRLFAFNCTTAGNLSLLLADDSTFIRPVQVGYYELPYAVKRVNITGTTAAASGPAWTNLR